VLQPLVVAQLDPAQVQHRMLHGDGHALSAAGVLTLVERGQDAGHRVDAGARVADLCPSGQRRALFESGCAHRAAHGLRDDFIRLVVRVRPVAKTLDGGEDQPWVDPLQLVPSEAHALDRAGAEILGEDVESGEQLGEDPLAFCGLHVQGDAPLVAVEHREIEAVDSRHVPQLLARDITRRSLQLHDVCAQPGENLRARRSGLDVCHVQDTDAFECLSQDSPLSCASVRGPRRIRDGVEPHVDQ
jgi:hypothetical protein